MKYGRNMLDTYFPRYVMIAEKGGTDSGISRRRTLDYFVRPEESMLMTRLVRVFCILEASMTQTTKPDKRMVRDWMDRRTHEHEPPPSPEDIRRELGWTICEAERDARERQERTE